MIFQDPFACLHPMYTVGDQIVEAVRVHERVPKTQARGPGASTCSAPSVSRTRGSGSRTTRISSRAACGSAP